MKDAFGVSKGYLGIGDHKKVRRAKLKQEASRANTDLAGSATVAAVSPFVAQQYNKRIQPRKPNWPKAPESKGQIPKLRVLAPLKGAQGVAGAVGGKAAKVAQHPGTLAAVGTAVGVPLTVHNYKEHQKDEKRVKRLEVRYPKRSSK